MKGRAVVWMAFAEPIWASGHGLASKAGHMTAFEPKPMACETYLNLTGPFSNRVLPVNGLLLARTLSDEIRLSRPSQSSRTADF
jgi:hypothetical protein